MLAPVQPLIDRLYTEIVARMKQDDSTVPVRYRGYWYVDPLRDRAGISDRGAPATARCAARRR